MSVSKLPLSERLRLAETSTSAKELRALAKDREPQVRLAEDEIRAVRLSVAEHPNTPPLLLYAFAGKGREFYTYLARNPSSPPDLLRKLFQENPSLEGVLAGNPACPKTANRSSKPTPLGRESPSWHGWGGRPSCPIDGPLGGRYGARQTHSPNPSGLKKGGGEGCKSSN